MPTISDSDDGFNFSGSEFNPFGPATARNAKSNPFEFKRMNKVPPRVQDRRSKVVFERQRKKFDFGGHINYNIGKNKEEQKSGLDQTISSSSTQKRNKV